MTAGKTVVEALTVADDTWDRIQDSYPVPNAVRSEHNELSSPFDVADQTRDLLSDVVAGPARWWSLFS